MSDEYDFVQKGTLKIKKSKLGINENSKKLKKKKKKHSNRLQNDQKLLKQAMDELNQQNSNDSNDFNNETESSVQTNEESKEEDCKEETIDSRSWMTKAERKFLAQQEKRQLARVMAKASKTHKQRVEEFNSNLEKLSEHYDIPKVSWTK